MLSLGQPNAMVGVGGNWNLKLKIKSWATGKKKNHTYLSLRETMSINEITKVCRASIKVKSEFGRMPTKERRVYQIILNKIEK